MRAVLLAAGVGSRISREVKKPMSLLDIGNGEVLLRYTVKMLRRHGIDVTIVVGFQKELFYEALKDLEVTFVENPFYRVSNSIASLWFAKEQLDCGEDYLFGTPMFSWRTRSWNGSWSRRRTSPCWRTTGKLRRGTIFSTARMAWSESTARSCR